MNARRLSIVSVVLAVAVLAGCRHDDPAPAPVVTTPPLARLRIIFPEGFTRREMAERVGAVREIAIRKRMVTPRLTASRVSPCKRADPASRGVPQGLVAHAFQRGLPVSGDVRVHEAHFPAAARP